jgi:Holliday junction resolvase
MDELRRSGYFCFKVHGSEYMMAGLPDIIVCADGLFIGLETKMPAKRENTSSRQEYVHGLIRQANGIAEVVCSPTEALVVVHRTLKQHKSGGKPE